MAEAPASTSAAALSQKSAPVQNGGKREVVPTKAPEAKAPEQPAAPDFKGTKHKVKVAKEEREIDYDELVRGYQMAQDSQRRYQEAQKMAAQAQAVNQALEKGDVRFLVQKLGPEKARAVFEDYLIQQLEFDNLPEAEKRAKLLERENQKLKSAAEKAREAQDRERYQGVVEKAHAELDQEIAQALSDAGGKPTPRLVIRILDEIEARISAKDTRISAADAKKKAVAGIYQDIAEYLPLLSADELLNIIPKDVVEKLNQRQVEQVLGEKQAKRVSAKRDPDVKRAKDSPTTVNDWYAKMNQKYAKRKA